MSALRLFAARAAGVEPRLAEELAALGATHPATVARGVQADADSVLLHRAHLELGLASHLLVRIGELRAASFADLWRGCGRIAFDRWIVPGTPPTVRARARSSRLYHTGAIEERVRRAVEGDRRVGIVAADGRMARPSATNPSDHARQVRFRGPGA